MSRHRGVTGIKGRQRCIASSSALVVLGLWAGAGAGREPEQMEANKKTVWSLYDAAFNKKDMALARTFMGPHYKQHNPMAKDDIEGLAGFVAYLKAKSPDFKVELLREFADGDYVMTHVWGHNGRQRPRLYRDGYFPARQRQGGRALGLGAADPGKGDEHERDEIAPALIERRRVTPDGCRRRFHQGRSDASPPACRQARLVGGSRTP